jgi:hypothetical protein
MLVMRSVARIAAVALGAGALVAALGAPAHGRGNGTGNEKGGESEGGREGSALTAEAHVPGIVVSGDTGGGSGSLEPVSGGWTPPVCWYEPWLTAEQFRDEVESMEGNAYRATNVWSPQSVFTDVYRDNNGEEWGTVFAEVYGFRSYENYNLDAEEEGVWWHAVINPNREDDFQYGRDCTEPIFWADPVEVPDLEEAVTDKTLAEYAYDEIDIPETEIEINPEGNQLVNLPTWVWVDAADFEPRTVRAELPINGVWAETTATPVSLTIDPGTEDAEVFPSSGECPIGDDGRIGEPYEDDRAEEDPPCGVTYLRATHQVDSYELTASLTWEVSWTGSQTQGENPLPSGTFETTHEIVVDESQAIVQ